MNDPSPAPQTDPVLFWNGPGASRWITEQVALDRMLEPFGREAMARAAIASGERVVDVGCGCGATTLALAEAVGPRGAVLGLDVSGPMIARARDRARGLAQVTFAEGDATTHVPDAPADLLFSRFGVMFFRDEAAAFANLHRMLRPGGRLSFACWRALRDNSWGSVPFDAVSGAVGGPVIALDAPGPGPFAFADPARVRGLLAAAAFEAIAVEAFDHDVVLGEGGIEDAVDFALRTGPASRLLAGVDEATQARARDAVRAALAPAEKAGRVALGAAAWMVTARRAEA